MSEQDSVRIKPLPIVLALTVLALATRFYGLGEWPFSGDEGYTVEDAAEVRIESWIKAGYYLIVAGLYRLFGISEWSTRVPAYLLAVVSVPVLYALARRFTTERAAILAALFTLASSWHLHYSQFGRFYSGVFLFGAVSYFLYFRALEKVSMRLIVAALAVNVVGLTFHTTFLVVPASCGLYSAVAILWRHARPVEGARRIAMIHFLLLVIPGLALVPFVYGRLIGWAGKEQFWGYGPINLVLQTAKYVGIPLSVCALLGLVVLRRSNAAKALFAATILACGGVFLVGAAPFMSMRPDYVFYVVPVLFVLAAHFCDECRRQTRSLGLLSHALAAILLVGMVPEFASHFTSRMSLDVRDAIGVVERGHRPGDRVVSFIGAGNYYLSGDLEPEPLPGNAYRDDLDWGPLLDPYVDAGERLWIVLPTRRHDIAENLRSWLSKNAFLLWNRSSQRYDYTYEGFHVYLVQPRS